ncbi:MAG: RNA polymerase sigma factor [Bacteroidia bacterium]
MTETEDTNRRFLELYEPCHDRLGRYIATMVWEKEEAKDVMSETVLVALEKFETLRQPEAFLYFLFGIASRLIKKKRSRSWRQLFFGNEDWEVLYEKQQVEYSVDETDLHNMLKRLGEKSKEALILFELSGFSIKEISLIQNSSLSGVKSRLVRARKTLEKMGTEEKNAVRLIV